MSVSQAQLPITFYILRRHKSHKTFSLLLPKVISSKMRLYDTREKKSCIIVLEMCVHYGMKRNVKKLSREKMKREKNRKWNSFSLIREEKTKTIVNHKFFPSS